MRKVEIIGKFFDNHSLAIINRKLAIGLSEVDNIEVFINPLDQYDPQYNVSSTDLKALKKLMKNIDEEPDIQIRPTYPPIWKWPVSDKTKVFQIQPWEYRKLPFETSAENMAKHLYDTIKEQTGLNIVKIEFQETKSSIVTYEGA